MQHRLHPDTLSEPEVPSRPAWSFLPWPPLEFDAKAIYSNFRRPRVEIEESYTVPE